MNVQVVAALGLTVIVAATVFAWWRYARARRIPATLEAERLRYLRAAEFPAACSWCKRTGVANQLLVFEGHGTTWSAADLVDQLRTCPDENVDALAAVLTSDQAAWRRFCTEKCVTEFLAAAPASAPVAFVSCGGCGASYPASLGRCSKCDATAPRPRP